MGVPLQMGAVPLDQDGSISISTNGRAPKDVLDSIFSAALEQGDIGITTSMNIIVTNTTPDLAGNVSIKKNEKKTRLGW
jgi:hypothetical protein